MDLENTFQFNNGDEGDDEKQCRTCLEQHSKHQLHSLDSQKHTVLNDGSEQTIAEIYHQCTQLLYVSDDAHFKWICQLCLEKLVDFYQFRKICIDSYHKLKQNEIMKDTLKLEAVDDYGDSSTFAMELDEATVIKRESFDCNTDQMNERSNVSMDEPVENTLVQSEQRDLDAVKADAADSTAFDDCIDDDGDSSNTSEIELSIKTDSSKGGPFYACDKCSGRFFKKSRFDAHMRRHMGLKGYTCEHCGKEFQKLVTLKAHIASKHYDESNGKPEFICDFDGCGKIYSRKESLRAHKQIIHEGRETKVCQECGKVFKNNAGLTKHIYTHTRISPHKCETCGKMFATAHKLKLHIMRHNDVRNHVCPTCGLRKVTADELRAHMRCHPELQFPYDEFFDDVTANHTNLDADKGLNPPHENTVQNQTKSNKNDRVVDPIRKAEAVIHHDQEKEELDNDENDTNFDDANNSDDDSEDSDDNVGKDIPFVRTRSGPKVTPTANTVTNAQPNQNEPIFACDKCPRKFYKQYRFDAHMRRHSGLKAYKCEHCDKAFQKHCSLKSHIEVKHCDESKELPEYICGIDDCGKKYTRKDSLRMHMKLIHLGRKVLEKICEQCGKIFKNNAALAKHTYTHTKVSPHKCELCSKMFQTAYKLKEHMFRHNNTKNFVCPVCGLRKISGHELRTHMRTHDTSVQFPCDQCSYVFKSAAILRSHKQRVHCGVKPFKCPYCDQSFGKAVTRKHHVARHTGEKPHACQICEKRFIQSTALKTHMKTHNKNK